mmetsp:Transcript_182723/g.578872  ORF Transcript_182723/g.578872 Transcript_182723/m.578872 type:complete len:273 (+) Transcript_182723:532-1350(+)
MRVGLPQSPKLLGVLVRRVAKQVLQVVHALWKGSMMHMFRIQVRKVAGMLVVSSLQRLQLPRVPVCGVAQQLFDILETFLDGRVAVLQALGVLIVRLLQGSQLLGVLVGGVGKSLLQVRHALRQGRVPARHARQLLRMLVMCSPEGLHIHGVLICRISQELLNVSNPVLGRGVVRGRVGDVLGVLGEGRGVLRVHHSKLLDLPRVLVCGVVEELLQVAEPLGDRGVVLMRGLQTRELLEVVVVCISQGLQLLRMLARGIPEKLLHVTQALPE